MALEKSGAILWKVMRLLLKTLTVFVLALTVFVAALGVGFFVTPELRVSSIRLERILARFAPADLAAHWKDASLLFVKTGPLSKEIRLQIEGICVGYKGEAIHSCFDQFKWGLNIAFKRFRPEITRYLPVTAIGGRISGNLDLLKDSEPPKSDEERFDAVEFLRKNFLPRWDLNGSLLEVTDLDLRSGENRVQGAILLETAETFQISKLSALAARRSSRKIRGDLNTDLARLTVLNLRYGDVRIDGQLHVLWPTQLEGLWRVIADIEGHLPKRRTVAVGLDGRLYAWDRADFELRAQVGNLAPLRDARLRAEYRGDRISGKVAAKIGGFASRVKSLDFVDCDYGVALVKKEAEVRCGPDTVRVALEEKGPFRQQAELFRLAPTFDLRLSNISYAQGVNADWVFRFGLNHLGFLQAGIDASGNVERPPQERERGGDFRFKMNGGARVAVSDFAKLVGFLRPTPYAVPAPFNRLIGPVTFNLSSDLSQAGGRAPFQLQTRLSAPHQKFFTTTSGYVDLNRQFDKWRPSATVDVVIEDALFAVPRLELRQPPALRPDSRFVKGLAEQRPVRRIRNHQPEENFPFDLRVNVATRAPDSLRLATNVTKNAVPVGVRYVLQTVTRAVPKGLEETAPSREKVVRSPASTAARTEASGERSAKTPVNASGKASETTASDVIRRTLESRGSIAIGRTELDIMRRNAAIDHFRMTFEPGALRRIDGRISVVYPEYDIDILVLGTVDQPVVRFESTPPLEENQIISVLLFGKPLGELGDDQQQSVAQLNSALTDAVLGFSSLYFLASTPVESVGYDPTRGMISVKLGIGDGTQLELGRGRQGATEVGLRRRLSRNWVLNTYIEDSADSDVALVSAFVEWVKRF